MKLRERVAHLEKWYDRQEAIDKLKAEVNLLRKELEAVKDYLAIRVETYKVLATSTRSEKKEAGK